MTFLECECPPWMQGHLFDAVQHYPDCPVMVDLEARIAEVLIPAGDVLDADVPTYVMQHTEARGWALVEVPGVDGQSSVPHWMA